MILTGVAALVAGASARISPGRLLLLDDPARDVLRALSEGLADETASRRLGLSLRTFRRRVADLMMALEADSRFQAGLRADQLGLAR